MPKKYIRTAHKMAGSTVPTHLIPLLPCLEHWHRHLGPLGGLAPDALAEHGAQIGAGQLLEYGHQGEERRNLWANRF